MSKSERWLTSVALVAGVLPLITAAFIMKMLPDKVSLTNFGLIGDIDGNMPEYMSKYNNLISGVFCIIPLSIVVIARYIKKRIVEYKNYSSILAVSMFLSLAFLFIVVISFEIQIRNTEEKIGPFDYNNLICIIFSLAMMLLANVTRFKKYRSGFGLNNKYSRSSHSVWKTVHHNCAFAQQILFVITAVSMPFVNDWYGYILFFSSLSVFMIFAYFYSKYIKMYFERKRDTVTVNTVTPQ